MFFKKVLSERILRKTVVEGTNRRSKIKVKKQNQPKLRTTLKEIEGGKYNKSYSKHYIRLAKVTMVQNEQRKIFSKRIA